MSLLAPIETDRLVLRLVAPEDAEGFTRLITPSISSKVGSWPAPFTMELAEKKVAATRAQAEAGQSMPFVITRKSDSALLGWIWIVRHEDDGSRGVLGYWLGEAYQRQGILREASFAFVDAGFERLGLATMEATCLPDNIASAATLRGLGFRWFKHDRVWANSRGIFEDCDFYERGRQTDR